MSLFTGDESLEIIKPSFCHLLDVYKHDDSAHEALYVLIVTIAIDSCFYLEKLHKFKRTIGLAMILVSFILAGMVARTAHQGAMLVYERGAAVKPVMSATCTP